MTGTSTFQILPRTNINGSTMVDITPDNVNNDICARQCKCLCESVEGCIGFTVESGDRNCRLKSAVTNTSISDGNITYIKGGRGNYYILWILLFLIIFASFLSASMYTNLQMNTPYWTESFGFH